MEEMISAQNAEVVQSVEEGAISVQTSEIVESVDGAQGAVAKKRKRRNRQERLDNFWGWAFCAPLLFGTIAFVYIALIITVVLSFTSYNGSTPLFEYLFGGNMSAMNGDPFYWYKYVFTNENLFRWVYCGLFNAVFYMIGIPIGMVLSMFFAVCMTRDIKGANVYRIIYYLPSVASTIAIVYTFNRLFYSTDAGVINQLIGKTIKWLNPEAGLAWSPSAITSKWVVIIMATWKGLGGTIILYIAGLSGINASHKEAASIDGANGWITFWRIVFPQLWPTIFYNIVTAVIGGMQIYTEPDLLFGGGNTGTYLQQTSGYVGLIVGYSHLGRMSADPLIGLSSVLGIFLAIIIMIMTLFQFYLDRKNNA